jgi:hypothetical protein
MSCNCKDRLDKLLHCHLLINDNYKILSTLQYGTLVPRLKYMDLESRKHLPWDGAGKSHDLRDSWFIYIMTPHSYLLGITNLPLLCFPNEFFRRSYDQSESSAIELAARRSTRQDSLLKFCREYGHPNWLWCVVYFAPFTWPIPRQPGVGHETVFNLSAWAEKHVK